MIWNREGQTWYSKDIIDKVKEVLHKKSYNAIEKVLKLIEDAENDKTEFYNI